VLFWYSSGKSSLRFIIYLLSIVSEVFIKTLAIYDCYLTFVI
jgi:hypothetical protein